MVFRTTARPHYDRGRDLLHLGTQVSVDNGSDIFVKSDPQTGKSKGFERLVVGRIAPDSAWQPNADDQVPTLYTASLSKEVLITGQTLPPLHTI